MSQLHYHKCHDCLTAFSSTEPKIDECDCGGDVFYMGQVQGEEYVKTEDRPPCDGRCTHAAGPVCNCKCGCVNHGTGRVVKTVVAKGKIKAEGLTEDDIKRADVYRKLRDYATMLFENKWKDRTNITHEEASLCAKDHKRLEKAVNMRVYNKRNQELVSFIADNK